MTTWAYNILRQQEREAFQDAKFNSEHAKALADSLKTEPGLPLTQREATEQETQEEQLDHLPKKILVQRALFMSLLLAQSSAAKDIEMKELKPGQRKQHIKKFSHELITFFVGGMSAPLSE